MNLLFIVAGVIGIALLAGIFMFGHNMSDRSSIGVEIEFDSPSEKQPTIAELVGIYLDGQTVGLPPKVADAPNEAADEAEADTDADADAEETTEPTTAEDDNAETAEDLKEELVTEEVEKKKKKKKKRKKKNNQTASTNKYLLKNFQFNLRDAVIYETILRRKY